jgi:hypothetical protein
MTTLNQLRQRLEDEYLEPAMEETPSVPMTTGINDSDLTMTLTSFILSPDEESYIAAGRVLEIGNECVRVQSYDELTKVVIMTREARGTTAEAHGVEDLVRIPTRWTRMIQLEAIAAGIEALWQPLFVAKEQRTIIDFARYIPLPLSTVRVLDVQYEARRSGKWRSVPSELFQTHPQDEDMAAVQLGRGPHPNALCVVRYGVKIEVPDDNVTDIVDLPRKWERIILADAAAQLMGGVDIDAQSQELLTEKMRLENFPVRSGSSISNGLIRYREYLVSQAHAEIKAAYPRKVVNTTADAWRL